MKNYVEPFPLCDKILFKLAQTQYRRMMYTNIHQSFAGNTDVLSALGQLVEDRYVTRDTSINGFYTLIASGSQFISDGGYQEEFKRQNLAEEIKRQINEANLEMSNAITDVSRATTKNAKTNTIVMYSTLLVAAVSALGTIGSFWISYKQDHRQQLLQSKPSVTALPMSSVQPVQGNSQALNSDTIKTGTLSIKTRK